MAQGKSPEPSLIGLAGIAKAGKTKRGRLKGEHGKGREQQGDKSKLLAGKLAREPETKPAPSPLKGVI